MLGFRELIILVLFFGIPLAIGFVIWRTSRRASGKITPAEYERQRASIISGV
ncbi:hypothetical protein [Silanimonas sp.]|jgi:hypothetical protein|uniref:hypothetical protein n=1 Tax=Silanimonas sp. TaxID=1929290 RepID=UPI0037C76560